MAVWPGQRLVVRADLRQMLLGLWLLRLESWPVIVVTAVDVSHVPALAT